MARKLVHLAYPPRCLSCGVETGTDHMLCQTCWSETHFFAGSVCNGCGVPLQGQAEAGDLCESCHTHPVLWSQGRSVGLYEGPLRRMVLALKHGDRQDIARHMARWMGSAGGGMITAETVLVPVPLHWSRMIRRRYNQSVLLAQALARTTGGVVVPDGLQRKRATKSQKDMRRDERFENQRSAIRPHPRRSALLRDRKVVLVDDVMTTGATLSACTEACFAAGAKTVSVLVFARVARLA
ncbi:ComF family protein [Neptunicoccus cionae]|uniref:ComF family protein n=1 Tax=Neptunicoccus cionae TaxID=2035344 RepID=UPI000C758803|nr:ComF family protein [Amylibacter cionae]PLS22811.1 amidophosphoribosyltransferase [Amylibacter cionae]